MNQPIFTREDCDKRAEIHELRYPPFIHHAHLNIRGDLFDTPACFLAGRIVGRGDLHRTIVGDVNRDACLFRDRPYRCPTLAADIPDLKRILGMLRVSM